jgi:hypothetical protein
MLITAITICSRASYIVPQGVTTQQVPGRGISATSQGKMKQPNATSVQVRHHFHNSAATYTEQVRASEFSERTSQDMVMVCNQLLQR